MATSWRLPDTCPQSWPLLDYYAQISSEGEGRSCPLWLAQAREHSWVQVSRPYVFSRQWLHATLRLWCQTHYKGLRNCTQLPDINTNNTELWPDGKQTKKKLIHWQNNPKPLLPTILDAWSLNKWNTHNFLSARSLNISSHVSRGAYFQHHGLLLASLRYLAPLSLGNTYTNSQQKRHS